MAAFEGQFRVESEAGRAALEQLKRLQVGDVYEESLFAALPEPIKWRCIEVLKGIGGAPHNDLVSLVGSFCGITVFTVEIRSDGQKVSLKCRESKK
jgi:hypothetical protein